MAQVKRGIILDVDGTLIDSNGYHAQAWVDALKEGGHDVEYSKVRPLIGKGGDKLLVEVVGIEEDSPEGKRLSERRGAIFNEQFLPKIKPFPNTRNMVLRMIEAGYQVAVGSSSERKQLDDLLERAQVKDLIGESASSSEAESSKPDPDIVEAARKKLGIPAVEVFMLGDTPYDIEAAGRAGIETIALRCGGWSDKGLRGAVAIYDDPEDLLRHFDESPLGKQAPRQS